MQKRIPSIFILLFLHVHALAQTDLVGSGRAIRFDGVNDYVDLGDIYDNITFPLTISAWIYAEPSTRYILPVFASQDNGSVYNGFWFCVTQTNVFFEYGDGRGDQNPAFRRGKSAPVPNLQGRWIHVSAVAISGNDIQLYVNGHNVGGDYTGGSTLPMDSDFPGDVAKIGYFFTNSVTHRFYGVIDELRVWNRSLTENEIRETMCRRLQGTEAALIGYWNFDETEGDVLTDLSSNGFHGTLMGYGARVFSGAPVGDESNFLYGGAWPGKSLTHGDVTVSGVTGTPYGVQIYRVNSIPSQTEGLDLSAVSPPYYGIFVADDHGESPFDFNFVGGSVCSAFNRKDNSVSEWVRSNSFDDIAGRIEIIPGPAAVGREIDLGPDITLCEGRGHVLEAEAGPSGRTFLWSTGETSPSITITGTGTYWVEASDACGTSADTITVAREVMPQLQSYNFISPGNGDGRNDTFIVDGPLEGTNFTVFNRWGKAVYESISYHNDWDGQGLPAGIYFYVIRRACFEPLKGTVTISR